MSINQPAAASSALNSMNHEDKHEPQRSEMRRRNFLQLVALGSAAAMTGQTLASAGPKPAPLAARSKVRTFDLDEATIAELQAGMKSGRYRSLSLAKKYLGRIEQIDKHGPAVNAVIEINPDVVAIARALDEEREAKGPRGALHGIPVLIKDNIGTHDRMTTTAGSLALAGSIPPGDSFVAQRLREAGAGILGKTKPSERVEFCSTDSTTRWSGRRRLTLNTYSLDRNPSGSSSGSAVAVAANLCAVAVG